MLAIQTHHFLVGTKISFPEWPRIVQTFLEQQSLHYDRFLYYFEDFNDANRLPKIIKDCPNIGPLRSRPSRNPNNGDIFYLSNIEEDTGCTEAEILSVAPRIHRRYGLPENHIIYQDVDFFSRKTTAIIQAPGITPQHIKGSASHSTGIQYSLDGAVLL